MTRHARTLADYVADLPPVLIRTLSNLIYTPSDGLWTLSYAGYGPEPERPQTLYIPGTNDSYDIIADICSPISPLPDGVDVVCLVRWPSDRVRTEDADTISALRDLQASELVGNLDIARIGDNLHARTHAGSDRERQEWTLGL
ncbi:MAG: hypothetical protein C4320_00495 [Armatimonadota bacterium]